MALYPINEVYFGRTPQIQKTFEQFCRFRDKFRSNKIGARYNPNINQDPDLITFNRMMEDLFGFGTFELYIMPGTALDGFTIPVTRATTIKDPKSLLIKTSSGIKYDKKANLGVLVIITSGFLVRDEFNDEELFGIILHEIGHNFQEALVSSISNISSIMLVTGYIMDIIEFVLTLNPSLLVGMTQGVIARNNFFRNTILKGIEELRKNTAFNAFVQYCHNIYAFSKDFVNMVLDAINGFTPILFNIVRVFPIIIINMLKGLLFMPLRLHRTAEENVADSFATMYGFGPALSSALFKFRTIKGTSGFAKEAIEGIPIIKDIISLNQLPLQLIMLTMDEHPTEYARSQNMIETLEYDLDNSKLDPKMRKTIQKDIDGIKSNINNIDYMLKNKPNEVSDIFGIIFQREIYHATGGDTRNFVKDIIPHKKNMDTTIKDLPITKVKLK